MSKIMGVIDLLYVAIFKFLTQWRDVGRQCNLDLFDFLQNLIPTIPNQSNMRSVRLSFNLRLMDRCYECGDLVKDEEEGGVTEGLCNAFSSIRRG